MRCEKEYWNNNNIKEKWKHCNFFLHFICMTIKSRPLQASSKGVEICTINLFNYVIKRRKGMLFGCLSSHEVFPLDWCFIQVLQICFIRLSTFHYVAGNGSQVVVYAVLALIIFSWLLVLILLTFTEYSTA